MNIGLYVGAAALGALDRWQDSIARNLGGSSTPGFRKTEAGFSVREAGSVASGAATGQAQSAVLFPSSKISVSFLKGEVAGTGRDLDIAIQGEGLFELQMPDGSKAYTRSGSFFVSSERTLVDGAGRLLLGDGGAPIQLLAEGGSLTIARDGTITQGEQPIGSIPVYQFADMGALQPLSGRLFAPLEGQVAEQVATPNLQQGALESSNVKPVEEMVNLIHVQRAYEAAQKIISTRDDMIDKTIRALI